MAKGVRVERVELAPWKRLEMLLTSVRDGKVWPPLATELAGALALLREHGIARLAVGVDGATARPVSEDDLAEVFASLGESLGEWPAPVAVRVEMFQPGPVRAAGEDGDGGEGGERVAVFTLKSSLPTAPPELEEVVEAPKRGRGGGRRGGRKSAAS